MSNKFLHIVNKDNKKNNQQKKMPLFPKNVVHFEFFTNEMVCERCKQDFENQVIVLNAKCDLILQYKNTRKTNFKKYYTIGLFQILQRQICQGDRRYVHSENQNCTWYYILWWNRRTIRLKRIYRQAKKVSQRVYNSPLSSTGELALQM